MKSNTKMYKTLSIEELAQLNIKITRKYYYYVDGEIKEIKEEFLENVFNENQVQLIDEECGWNPKTDSLYLDINFHLKECSCIFGLNGSCYDDAVIGVGLTWKAEKSRIKRCKKLGQFTKTSKEITMTEKGIILENISSNCEFRIFFYVVKPGKTLGNPYFGNEEGIIIHDQLAWMIIVQGNGSVFPITEIEDENGPLWSYSCDVTEVCEDYFNEDNILISFNRSHSLYPVIHHKCDEYNERVLNEIMSDAITMIIMDIRSKQPQNKIDLSQDFEKGSVLQALVYFKEKLGFDINGDYGSLLKSVKSYFDKEF